MYRVKIDRADHPLLKSRGNKPRRGKVKLCRNCGNEFYMPPSRMQPYCSVNCFREDRAAKTSKIAKKCKRCSKEYSAFRSQIKHRGSNFCSWNCMMNWKTEQAATPTARSHRRKMRSGTMRSLDNIFSKVIRARDKVCQHCGTAEMLQCSHVMPRTYLSVRWNMENAIALCYRCHVYWWHKYPHEATAWFDSKWPGRHANVRELANQHPKIDKPAELQRLKALLNSLREYNGPIGEEL